MAEPTKIIKIPAPQIVRPDYVMIFSILFTPLAGGILTAFDYKKFQLRNWITILILPSLLFIITFFIQILLFPNNIWISIVIDLLFAYTFYLYQERLKKGLKLYSYRSFVSTFFRALIGLFAYIGILLIIFVSIGIDVNTLI